MPRVFTRIVLPVTILVIGIACIAWVTQYLPSRGRPTPGATAPNLLQIMPPTFVWDAVFDGTENKWAPRDPGYTIPEFELGTPGHYDYQFANPGKSDIDFGVAYTSCSCSGVALCVFQSQKDRDAYQNDNDSRSLTWTKVEIDKEMRHKITIPAESSGVLRIAWTGAKTEPEQMRLTTKIWSRAGYGQDAIAKELVVLVNYVQPVRFGRENIDLGTINPKDQRTDSFVCWSATRDLEIKPAGSDKRFEVIAKKLDDKECQQLQNELRSQKMMTRIRSAYRIGVTLFEESAGQQLDMGLFLKPIPLAITGDGQPLDVPMPRVRALVLGDVSLGPPEEGGRIDFNIFAAKVGKTKKVTLFSAKGAKLSFVGCDPPLLDLDVELKMVKAVGDKAQWQMDVTAKPNRDPGLLPENGVLVLNCESPATQATPASTRLVRIPVIGTAASRH
jgi:hypothetical protein